MEDMTNVQLFAQPTNDEIVSFLEQTSPELVMNARQALVIAYQSKIIQTLLADQATEATEETEEDDEVEG